MQLCSSLSILWHCLCLGLERKLTFSSPVATAEFSKFADHIERSTFTASSFRIWNSSTGIPSPPLALFVVMLSKAHLTSHSRMSGSKWVLYWAHLCMKCSLGTSNFLEDISSLSHSIVFLYFCARITEEGFLTSSCYSWELCIQMSISFIFSFDFHFSSFHSYF